MVLIVPMTMAVIGSRPFSDQPHHTETPFSKNFQRLVVFRIRTGRAASPSSLALYLQHTQLTQVMSFLFVVRAPDGVFLLHVEVRAEVELRLQKLPPSIASIRLVHLFMKGRLDVDLGCCCPLHSEDRRAGGIHGSFFDGA